MKIEFDELTISEAEAFYKLLTENIDNLENNELTLDFNDVEKIDLSCVQVLFSLKKFCTNTNINLSFTNLQSKQLQKTIKTYNLEKLLGLTQ
ncbi:MAG: STAS domain-containing protein [Halarcobacter sp.]